MRHFLLASRSLIVFIVILILATEAARADTIEDNRIWMSFTLMSKPPKDEGWGWSVDVRSRWREGGDELDQVFMVPSTYYQFSSKFNLGLLIDHVVNHPAGKVAFDENRLATQAIYKFDDVGNVKLQSRTQLEMRHREDFSDEAYRLREQLRASVPLGFNPKLSIVVYDEIFFNLNSTRWKVDRGTDQNRVFFGLNYKLDDAQTVEAGYLNQWVNSKPQDRENHVLSFSYKYTL